MAALVVVAYTVYIYSHVLTGQDIPNGVLLSGVIGAVCALGGVQYQKNKQRRFVKVSNEDREP